MADTVEGTHTITWDPDGNPLLDGQPLYRSVANSPSMDYDGHP
jgi:hypothetical protein